MYVAIYGSFAVGPFRTKEDAIYWWKNQTAFGSTEPDSILLFVIPDVIRK